MSTFIIKGVKTIEQYEILKYIYSNFHHHTIKTELINESCVKVTDKQEDELYFYKHENEILFSEICSQKSTLKKLQVTKAKKK